MSAPHRCPNCNGTGQVNNYTGDKPKHGDWLKTCHSCNGKGIVWEPELWERLEPSGHTVENPHPRKWEWGR